MLRWGVKLWGRASGALDIRTDARWRLFGVYFFVLPVLVGFGPPRLVDREIAPTARVSMGELRRWAELRELPDLSASGYLVYDVTTGQVLVGERTDQPLPPASLTKLMTALLVLERGGLDEVVTVVPDDIVGGATMGLRPGMQLSVTDLLWGLLVPSGNDAALALARHVSGDTAAFVAAMNRRAAELGLLETHFLNPHGLDAPGHVSSARDLLRLTLQLWSDPLFRTMVGTVRVTVAGRELRNTNELLTTSAVAVGVKTGTTPAAGECLIAAVERAERTVLVVILGSRDRYGDAERLLAATDAAFAWVPARAEELTLLNRMIGEDGSITWMMATGAPPLYLEVGPGVPTLTAFRQIERGLVGGTGAGMQVGHIDWYAGNEWIGMQTLVVR